MLLRPNRRRLPVSQICKTQSSRKALVAEMLLAVGDVLYRHKQAVPQPFPPATLTTPPLPSGFFTVSLSPRSICSCIFSPNAPSDFALLHCFSHINILSLSVPSICFPCTILCFRTSATPSACVIPSVASFEDASSDRCLLKPSRTWERAACSRCVSPYMRN